MADDLVMPEIETGIAPPGKGRHPLPVHVHLLATMKPGNSVVLGVKEGRRFAGFAKKHGWSLTVRQISATECRVWRGDPKAVAIETPAPI